MYNFTVAITIGSYVFQLQSSHYQAVYVRSIKGNYIPVAYIGLKLISGKVYDCHMLKMFTIEKVLYKIKQLSHIFL